MSLKGKTLLITGASRGIGLAIAKRAAQDGANIAVLAKTTEPHPKLPGTIFTAVEEIEAAGGKGLAIATDIRFEDQVESAVAQTVETFGGIDICINNASAISLTGTLQTPMKRYDLMHQINTRGTYLVSQKCLPWLLKSDNPHILEPFATVKHAAEMVWLACRVHDGQIWNEHVRLRYGCRIRQGRIGVQCVVATNSDCNRSRAKPVGRRRNRQVLANAGDYVGCRSHHFDSTQPRL